MDNNMPSSLIETQNLQVYYEDKQILKDVNLKVDHGEFVYFIGKVGSGKSSLLKIFYGDLPIRTGSAFVLNQDISKIKSRHIPALRRKLGMVFQDSVLLSDRSVYKNLEFVLRATGWKNKQDIDVRINEVLESVGMRHKINSLPPQMSGGERQSISIARALLNNPSIIFADEPTGNLDPESATMIMNILYKLVDNGKAVVMVTHNYNIIKKYPGKVFMFENESVHLQTDDDIAIEL